MPSSDVTLSSITTNVPAPSLGDAGFTAPSEQDILTGVLADMNAALGGGANTALSTPQGQLAISETAILGDALSLMLGVFNEVDPATSSRRMQEAIGRIYFMTRRPATVTTVAVQASVNGPDQTITAGTTVAQGSDGSLYIAPQDITLPNTSTANLDLACQTAGAVFCPAESLTLYQAGLGISALSNAAHAASRPHAVKEPFMNPYFAGSFLLAVLAFLGSLIWYANRAGKRSAEVSNSERDTETANATTAATQRMLNAKTNGIRDEDALIGELNKGAF